MKLILALLIPMVAQAKFATPADSPYVIESDQTTITVEADGQSTLVRDITIRINNDQGREAQSVQTLSFNSRAQTFKILEAATLNTAPGGKIVRTPVPKKDIEVKEVGEMSQSFDSMKQAGLSFPKVSIGSRIHMKYEMKNIEVPIKGFWSIGFSLSGDTIEKFGLHVHSKLPLNFDARDDLNRFASDLKPSGNGWMDLDIHSTAPFYEAIVQEESPFLRPERVPSISISSLPDWTRYGSELIPVHEQLLAKPLPAALEEIRAKAAAGKTPDEQIQIVEASIAQEFRYFGDWRRRHGGYIPRSLNEIADSRYGDCKDLALTVTAIFRALGFKSNLAWIFRGDQAPDSAAYKVPVDTAFNHAISKVEKDGHVWWVDATDPVSYTRGPFPDIADRPAFVLYREGGHLERTPALTAADSLFGSHLSYAFQSGGEMEVSGDIKMGARHAIGITIRSFYSPIQAVNYDIIQSLANNGKVTDAKVGDFDHGSRIVHDITIPVKFKLGDSGLRTSAGFGFPLFRDDAVGRLLVDTTDRVSDIMIEPPSTSQSVIDLLNVRRVGHTSLDCSLSNEFVDLKRTVTDISGGVSIADTVVVKKAIVPLKTAQGAEFAKFQNDARSCFNRAAVILEKR